MPCYYGKNANALLIWNKMPMPCYYGQSENDDLQLNMSEQLFILKKYVNNNDNITRQTDYNIVNYTYFRRGHRG